QVAVDMVLLDRAVNLVDERIDLALRITNELDPNLIARELMWCHSVICASPAYLREHGRPQRIEDLSTHNCLTHFYYGKSVWHFDHNGEPVSVPVSGNISTNESAALMQTTLAGAGIAMLPLYLVARALRSGELIEVLPEYRAQGARLYAVYASRKHMPASLRTMLEFLGERFRSVSEWDSHDMPREQRREHPPGQGGHAPPA
ncbi:substrate binding domain-containing protein, partial [Paraburkholderia sp.]|uniref:substrate binding domain-containing protein n=1 Tax=Paraburkholderia sp. TaxID=1926495 RepID=UPI003C7D0F01